MLTTGEIARLFNVSAQTVINWLDQGRMNYSRMGRGPRRVAEKDVMKYIDEHQVPPHTLDQNIWNRLTGNVVSGNTVYDSPLVVADANRKLVYVHQKVAKFAGYQMGDLIGTEITQLISSKTNFSFQKHVTEGPLRVNLICADGHKVELDAMANPLRSVDSFLGICLCIALK